MTMTRNGLSSRCRFLQLVGAWGCGLTLRDAAIAAQGATVESGELPETAAWVEAIADPTIRRGVVSAIVRNLLPAAGELQYPGHFSISADGAAFGADTTWPGLDSLQMTGAYLLWAAATRAGLL